MLVCRDAGVCSSVVALNVAPVREAPCLCATVWVTEHCEHVYCAPGNVCYSKRKQMAYVYEFQCDSDHVYL